MRRCTTAIISFPLYSHSNWELRNQLNRVHDCTRRDEMKLGRAHRKALHSVFLTCTDTKTWLTAQQTHAFYNEEQISSTRAWQRQHQVWLSSLASLVPLWGLWQCKTAGGKWHCWATLSIVHIQAFRWHLKRFMGQVIFIKLKQTSLTSKANVTTKSCNNVHLILLSCNCRHKCHWEKLCMTHNTRIKRQQWLGGILVFLNLGHGP